MTDFSSTELEALTVTTRRRAVTKFQSNEEMLAWLAADFCNFIQYANYCMNKKTAKIQLLMASELQSGETAILLMCFRNSSKSYMIDLYCIWRLHRFHNTEILILSAKLEGAVKHISMIKKYIAKMPALSYMKDFRINQSRSLDLMCSSPTNKDQVNIRAEGIFSRTEGGRCHLCVLDDVETKVNSESKESRDKLIERYIEATAQLHPPHSLTDSVETKPEKLCRVFIGTPMSNDSTYFAPTESNEGHPLNGVRVVKIPALAHERSTFPERWTTHVLTQSIKPTLTKPEWARQYLMDPTLCDAASKVIDPRKIIKTNISPDSLRLKTMAIDTAGEHGGGDHWSYCILGLTDKDFAHVLKLYGSRKTNAESFLKMCLSEAKKFGVEKIRIECNFGGYEFLIRNLDNNDSSSRYSIEAVRSVGNKQDRLVQILDPSINSGRVTFQPEIFDSQEVKDQFQFWTYQSLPPYDDMLDALAIAIEPYLPKLKWCGIDLKKTNEDAYKNVMRNPW